MEATAEEGRMFLVLDEIAAGVLMPRYATMPTINNMEHLQCGFYAVVSHEQPAEPWAAWARLFELDPSGTPDTPWADEEASIDDGLVWVGAGIGQNPQYVIHHYLGVQASFWGNASNTLWDGSTYLKADESMNPVPIPVFGYQWFEDSIAFLVDTTDWDDTNLNWDLTAEAQSYTHTFQVTMANRRSLQFALDYPDPHRPYQVRFANLVEASWSMYKKMLADIRTDWSSLYTSPSIETVPIDKDNSRYISAFRRPNVRAEAKPLRASTSQSKRSYPSRNDKPSSFREAMGDAGAGLKGQLEKTFTMIEEISSADSAQAIISAIKARFDATLAGVVLDYLTKAGTNPRSMQRRARSITGKTADEIRELLAK
jgi:hypothetical protein